jgi:SSS family transporter
MGLNSTDFAVIAAYLVAVTLFGLCFRSPARTLRGYFLAANQIPWWAISLSIVAAETSTLTIISVPGLAYQKDFRFLELAFGYIAGRAVVAFLLIPHYFRGELVTAYQLIERRFGQGLRTLTAALFLLTRAAAEGVRVFAVAIVVRIALAPFLAGMSDLERDLAAIGLVTLLTLAYTLQGGMRAVIWTDVVQLALYLAGVIVAMITILHAVPGGWNSIADVAGRAGKFRMIDTSWSLSTTYTLWSGVIGGTFFTVASHGTDQLFVQRLLAARNERQAKAAILASGIAVFAQFTLFLLLGAMLFVFFTLHPPAAAFARSDSIFPTFIVTRMPHVAAGLLISAILAAAMSNLSAALNSLSSTTIVDFYARIFPRSTDERRVFHARAATLVWGVILFALALLARHGGTVLEMGLSIASVAYGSLLGVFLLGVLTRTANERGAMIGMLVGLACNLYLWRFTSISFLWYTMLGSAVTFFVGYLVSGIPPKSSRQPRNMEAGN